VRLKVVKVLYLRFLERLVHLGFGVYSDEVQVLPDHVNQAVQIPLLVGAHGAVVRELGDDVQLLQRDLIDLVDDVDGRNVDPGALYHIHLQSTALAPKLFSFCLSGQSLSHRDDAAEVGVARR